MLPSAGRCQHCQPCPVQVRLLALAARLHPVADQVPAKERRSMGFHTFTEINEIGKCLTKNIFKIYQNEFYNLPVGYIRQLPRQRRFSGTSSLFSNLKTSLRFSSPDMIAYILLLRTPINLLDRFRS